MARLKLDFHPCLKREFILLATWDTYGTFKYLNGPKGLKNIYSVVISKPVLASYQLTGRY